MAFAIRDVSVTPIEPKQTAEPVEALPGFSEDAKPFSQKSEAPALRAIEGNPEAKPDKKPAARKFRVIESK